MVKRNARLRGIGAATLAAGLVLAACGAPASPESESAPTATDLPAEPIELNILDVGGVLGFTRPMIEAFPAERADLVSSINLQQAPSTEAVSSIRAQQAAGQVEVDLVISGSDVIGAGLQSDIWIELLPASEEQLANTADYTEAAGQVLELAQGRAVVVATEFTGPLLEYGPQVTDPPSTPDELLEWARANPQRFTYPRPPSSGPGRQFLMGLPYLLGDEDPRDPENGWDNTWAFLAELDQYTAPYPSSTSEALQSFAQGAYDLIVTAAGWDLGTRAEGIVPLDFEIQTFDDFTWITAGHYMAVPQGLPSERLAVVLELMNFLLEPEQQVGIYAAQTKAQPGPAIEGVTLDDAPQDVQQAIGEFSRPEYEDLFANVPAAPELDAQTLAAALDRWDREIGA